MKTNKKDSRIQTNELDLDREEEQLLAEIARLKSELAQATLDNDFLRSCWQSVNEMRRSQVVAGASESTSRTVRQR